MFFPEAIFGHLFPIDDFVSDVLFGGFDGLRGEKEPDDIRVGSIGHDELGRDYIL